ncbi:MAG: efflux RND transporter periplasmic adaptor subunit [Phycisphaerales bacterium]
MKFGRIVAAAFILGSLLLIGAGLAWWKYGQIKAAMSAPPPPEPAAAAELLDVVARPWTPTVRLVGSVFALESISVSNEVSGVVRAVAFESGQVVDAGQVLLQLDDATEQADLAAARATQRVADADVQVAEAQVRSAQASATLAASDLRRVRQAVESKAAAETTLDRAAADVEQAQALLAQAMSGVERAKAASEQAAAKVRQLEALAQKKTIKAPFKARVGIRSVHPGQYLGENTRVADLQGIADTVYLDFAIPQDQAWRVKPGMIFPAISATLGEGLVPLRVQAVDASVDRATRNVRVRSVVPNPDERLRPGTFVDVEVPLGEPGERLLVPAVAVRRSSYGDHVFVAEPAEQPGLFRVRQRFVTLGAGVGGDVIVEKGLAAGDRIATSGSFKLRDGALVMPPAKEPASSAPAK